jgi:hypothetical protein
MAEPSLLSNLAEEDLNSVFGPAPTEPAPTEPALTEPALTEPAPTEPAPTEPATGGGLLLNLSEQELDRAFGGSSFRDPIYESELQRQERRARLMSGDQAIESLLGTTRRGSRVEQERLYKQYMAGRQGVPLVQRDDSPLGFMDRLQLSFLNDADAQVEKLNQEILKDPRIDPTKHQARYTPSTGLIIPQYNEESGQVEDVVVDPDGVDWANVAGFIAPNLIPLAGEAATALRLAKRTSMAAGSLRRLTTQSAAGAGAGQVQEAATRLLFGVSQDEIADTLTEFGLETTAGTLLDSIVARTGKLVTPFGDVAPDPEREAALAAAKRLGITPNVGEQTGSPFFGKLESFLRKQWALGGKLERLELDRQNQILDQLAGLQPSIMPQGYRSTYLPTKDLFDSIDRQLYDEAVDNVARAREISGALTEEAMRTVGAQPVGVRISSVADAGKALRNHLNVTLNAFRKQANKNYGEVDRLIEDYTQAYGNQFDFDRLVKFPDLAGLEREIKKGTKYVTTGTTTFKAPDPSGIGFTTATKDVDVEKALPSRWNKKVTSVLSDLKKVNEGMSIDTARKILRDVNNSISASNGFNSAGLGTYDVKILKDIRARLIEGLDDAASSMPNQSLKNAMEKANFDYSKSADALKSSQIQDILQDSKGKRFPDSELLKYVYSDSKNYDLIMDYVDQTPGLKDQFKKSIVDAFIGDFSRGSVISPSDISREFGKLNRSVVEDLLGPRYAEKLDFLKEISSMSSREWGKLSPTDVYANQAAVDSFLRNPVSAKTKMVLKDSMKDYAEKAQSLKRNLRRKITDTNIDDVLEQDGLAGILIDSATPKQIGQFVNQIGNGQKRQALEYKAVEELLRRSGMYNAVARHHAVKSVSYQPEIVGKKLNDELNKSAYREIFSPDLYSKLDDLATFLTYRDKAFERFGSNAASLSSGDNISGFLTTLISPKKWASGIEQATGYRIAAAFLASPKARAVLTSPFFRKDSKSLVALLTSNTLISNEIVSLLGNSPVALKDLSKALVALEDVPPETRLLDELSEPEQDTQPQPQPEPTQQ